MSDTILVCPRCGSEMTTYSRSGIEIDRCTGCRGVFLDRGELEQLIDAETAYYQQQQSATPPAAAYPSPNYAPQAPYPAPDPYYGRYGEGHHGEGHHGSYHGDDHYGRHGFLGRIFD